MTAAEQAILALMMRKYRAEAEEVEYKAECARLTLDSVRREHAKLYGDGASVLARRLPS